MATHNLNRPELHAEAPPETRLDGLLRDHLTAQGHTVGPASGTLRAVLQRAQTEIEQVPPLITLTQGMPSEPEPTPLHVSAAVLLSERPRPAITGTVYRVSFREALLETRQLMDMKMFRTIGSAVSALGVSR